MFLSPNSAGELEAHTENCLALPWTVAKEILNTTSFIYVPGLWLFQLYQTQGYPRLTHFCSARVTEMNKARLYSGISGVTGLHNLHGLS